MEIFYETSNNSLIKIIIIDNAGQERLRGVNKSYYSKVDSCILVYDITSKESFNECLEFNQIIKENCKKNVKLMLLGNKSDEESKREVSQKEGQDFAHSNNYDLFYETSCVKNENVSEAFEHLIAISEMEEDQNNLILNKRKTKKTKKTCC